MAVILYHSLCFVYLFIYFLIYLELHEASLVFFFSCIFVFNII